MSYSKSLLYAMNIQAQSATSLVVYPGPVDTDMAKDNSPSLNEEDEKKRKAGRQNPMEVRR